MSRLQKINTFLENNTATIVMFIISIFVVTGMLISVPQTIHSPPVILEVPVEQPPVMVNPEVKIMSKYIKLRNNRVPNEVAMIIAESIVEVSETYGISPYLLNGIAEKESIYDCYAVSNANAKGVMQVLIEDGVEIDEKQVFNIRYNIQKSAEILSSKLKKSGGSIKVALEKYSGNAKGYSSMVYENIGRYVVYKDRSANENEKLTMN